MKKIIFSILLAIVVVVAVALAEFFPTVIVTGINGKWVDTRAYTTLAAAVTAVGGNERIIIIIGEEAVGTLTIPINVRLKFMSNGSLAVATQLTLQTYDIDAGDRQIFSGVGDIDFPSGTVVRSTWFPDLDEALDVTSDDTLTMVVAESETLTADASVGAAVTLRWESPFIITDGGFTLDGLKKIEAGTYQIFSGANDFDFLAGSVVHSSWFVDLRRAITFTSDENVELTILVDQPETIDTDTTIDAYQELQVEKGCIVTVTAGDNFTIYNPGNVNAGPYQIKTGAGTLAFSNGGIIFAEWVGAVGDGVVDDTAAIQEALNIIGTAGGGIVHLLAKTYACNNLEIEDYEGIVGTKLGAPRWSTAAGVSVIKDTILKLNATGDVIDTPVAQQDGIYIEGIHFQGLGAGTAGVGIRFRDVDFSFVRQCSFDNFSDQGLVQSAGTANKFEDLHFVNCVLDRTQADHVGAIHLIGVDMHLSRIEATTSQAAVSDANLYLCGILIEGATSGVAFIEDCIGEISDIGIRIEGTLNRIVNCRADKNWAHGFQVTGSRNQFTNCSSISNSADTTNTYDAWDVSSTGSGNTFVNCDAVSRAADGYVHRYGFVDDVEDMTAITTKNRYVGCHSVLHGTAAFIQTGNSERGSLIDFVMGPPLLATNLDVTPTVEQAHFLRVDYNAPTNVTDFDDGIEGQVLYLLSHANSNVTVVHDVAKIKTTTGANVNIVAGIVYCFINYDDIWHQLGH